MLEWLKTILGENYSEDIDKKVSDEIGKGFIARADYNAKNEAYKGLQTQIAERDKQLEELKKVDAAGLQATIEKLQSDNKAAKEAHDKELADLKRGYAVDKALTAAKVKNLKAVRALLKDEDIKLDGDKLTGLDEQLKAIKESDSYLFEAEKQTPQFAGSTSGGGTGTDPMAAIRAAAGLKTD